MATKGKKTDIKRPSTKSKVSRKKVSEDSVPSKKRKKTGGRAKGVQNKATREVKEALISAFEELGGVDGLVEWGKKNQTEFYKLWVKLLPAQLNLAGANGKDLFAKFAEAVNAESN